MNRRILLLLLSPLLLLTGVPAIGGTINFRDLIPANACLTAPDPSTLGAEFGLPYGCWNLQNQNSDNTIGGAANGNSIAGASYATVTGSDVNTADPQTGIANGGPLFVSGMPISTYTLFTTVISAATPGVDTAADGVTLSGDLTFNWNFTTADAGSFYDPAGYVLCPAAPTGFPSGMCGLYQLTSDFDAVNAEDDPANPSQETGFAESGSWTVFNLAPGDVFGAYVNTPDNANGAGTITFSDPLGPGTISDTPEPASFLLIGGGLLALGSAGQKARRRQAGKAAKIV
jgi:hypothetical protein